MIMNSPQNKKSYVRKRENSFEDVTCHKISRPGFIKTPEENMQKYLSEVDGFFIVFILKYIF